MGTLRGLCIGAGYFSRFHLEAWQRIENVEIAGICDLDGAKAAEAARAHAISSHWTDARRAMDELAPDFVDIITPPETHLGLVKEAAGRGLATLCQKPLAPSFDEGRRIVEAAERGGIPFMVHDNFRFQPWHREIKRLIADGAVGERLHSLAWRCRMGDGWGADAYLGRQPYFREMPRLLVHETGVHFIDTFRYLAGEIEGVYAMLRRLNPAIRGEDAGVILFEFASGAVGLWDANRYNEANDPDPRFTFGEFLVEGSGGSIRLYLDGRLTVQPLGQGEREHEYVRERRGFAGDCVYPALRHFIDSLRTGNPFETPGRDYLRTLAVEEAVYRSAGEGRPIRGLARAC